MKNLRGFLKGLDIDSETIDTIMVEVGKQFTGVKEENETLKTQIKDLNEKIKVFGDKDLSEVNKSLTDLTDENKDLKAQIMMADCGVKKEFSKFVRSEVMSKVDDKTDFKKALEEYKKENSQYFGETVVKKVQTSPNLNGGNNQETTTSDIMNNLLRGARNND